MNFGTMMQSAKDAVLPLLLNKAMEIIVGPVWIAVKTSVAMMENETLTPEEKKKNVIAYLKGVAEVVGKDLGNNVLDLIIAAAVYMLRRKMA